MCSLALSAGLHPRQVADLEADEFQVLRRASVEREKRFAWSYEHELLAAVVESLWAVLARLESGIPVVEVRSTKKPKDLGRYPRPPWIQASDESSEGEGKEVVVTSLRDAVRIMRGGGARVG